MRVVPKLRQVVDRLDDLLQDIHRELDIRPSRTSRLYDHCFSRALEAFGLYIQLVDARG